MHNLFCTTAFLMPNHYDLIAYETNLKSFLNFYVDIIVSLLFHDKIAGWLQYFLLENDYLEV